MTANPAYHPTPARLPDEASGVSKTVRLSNLAVPPGELLQEELAARRMSDDELAAKLGMPVLAVRELFGGERAVTPQTAAALERLWNIPAALWLNLEASYRLTLAHNLETYGEPNPFAGYESGPPAAGG